MMRDALNAEEIIGLIPDIQPMDRAVCLKPVTGKNGTYKINIEVLEALSAFDWNQLYGLGAVDEKVKNQS